MAPHNPKESFDSKASQKNSKGQEDGVKNLNQEHYQSILNTVMHLHLLEQYKQDYLNLPQIELPKPWKRSQELLLILDIDETMIHTIDERDPPNMRGQYKIQIPDLGSSERQDIWLNVRPHLEECLDELTENFQIIAFTAGEQTYADAILDFLDPHGKYF